MAKRLANLALAASIGEHGRRRRRAGGAASRRAGRAAARPCGIGFFLLHPEGGGTFDLFGMLLVLVAFLALIVAHELIHGLVWGICAKRHWKAVSFGVIWKYLTPYCTCDEPLSRRAYVAGALAPTIVLSLVPVAVAYVTGSILWLGIGLLMILGGGGDLAIVLKMLRFKPDDADVLYLDHPYECGLVAFVRSSART
ncbi:DUF3267 domain-containing protein [Rubneribacter sp.]